MSENSEQDQTTPKHSNDDGEVLNPSASEDAQIVGISSSIFEGSLPPPE